LNPGCFDDVNAFKYRDLQQLAKHVGVPANGKRTDLVKRLQKWHRTQFSDIRDERDAASNFTLLKVDVISPTSGPKVEPALLSPLIKKPRKRADGTPVGILTPSKTNRRRAATPGASAKKRIKFSCFNGVKIIPDRETHNAMHKKSFKLSFVTNDHENAVNDMAIDTNSTGKSAECNTMGLLEDLLMEEC
jgi:SAP domain